MTKNDWGGFLKSSCAAFPDWSWETTNLFACGDTVILETSERGTWTKPWDLSGNILEPSGDLRGREGSCPRPRTLVSHRKGPNGSSHQHKRAGRRPVGDIRRRGVDVGTTYVRLQETSPVGGRSGADVVRIGELRRGRFHGSERIRYLPQVLVNLQSWNISKIRTTQLY